MSARSCEWRCRKNKRIVGIRDVRDVCFFWAAMRRPVVVPSRGESRDGNQGPHRLAVLHAREQRGFITILSFLQQVKVCIGICRESRFSRLKHNRIRSLTPQQMKVRIGIRGECAYSRIQRSRCTFASHVQACCYPFLSLSRACLSAAFASELPGAGVRQRR